MDNLIYYVAGVEVPLPGRGKDKEFKLIHPSANEHPYITNNPNSSALRGCGYSAALYRVNLENNVLTKQLDKHYEIAIEEQPDVVTLAGTQARLLQEAIAAQDTYLA